MFNLAYYTSFVDNGQFRIMKSAKIVQTMFKEFSELLSISRKNQCVSLDKMKTLCIVLAILATNLLIESATGSVVPRPQEDKQAEVQKTVSDLRNK